MSAGGPPPWTPCAWTGSGWQTWLAFRDHLRATPADRDEYAGIKRELAAADDEDRPAYRAGKAPFITRILENLEGR